MLKQKPIKTKQKSSINPLLIVLPVAALVIVVTVLIILKLTTTNKNKRPEEPIAEESIGNMDELNLADLPYANETNYKGNLSQFPELYQFPFKKTDNYVMNKEFSKKFLDRFSLIQDAGSKFITTFCNVNYRELETNRYEWLTEVSDCIDPTTSIVENIDGKETELTWDEYNIYASNYFINNEVQLEAEFFTDDSLVYEDIYSYVRGELVFTFYSNKDTECKYEIGKEYSIPVDIAIKRTLDDKRVVKSITLVDSTDNWIIE